MYPALKLIGYLDADTIMAAGYTAMFMVLAVLAWRRVRLVTYCIAFFLIAMAPMAQLVPTGLPVAAADRFFMCRRLGSFFSWVGC